MIDVQTWKRRGKGDRWGRHLGLSSKMFESSPKVKLEGSKSQLHCEHKEYKGQRPFCRGRMILEVYR